MLSQLFISEINMYICFEYFCQFVVVIVIIIIATTITVAYISYSLTLYQTFKEF